MYWLLDRDLMIVLLISVVAAATGFAAASFAASSQQHAVQCRRPSTKKWCESGRDQRDSRDQQQDKDQLAKTGFIQMSIKL